MKRTITGSCVIASLTVSMLSSQPATTSFESGLLLLPQGRTVKLGQGYNSLTGQLANACVEDTSVSKDIEKLVAFGRVASAFDEVQDAASLSRFMSVGLAVEATQPTWNASLNARLARSVRSSRRGHSAAGRTEVYHAARGLSCTR